MDLAALRKRTRLLAGMEMDALMSNPEVDDVINEVYRGVCDDDWPFMLDEDDLTTADGTHTYDVPDDLEKPGTLDVTDGHASTAPIPLQQTSTRWMDAVDPDDDGTPKAYAFYAQTDELRFYPTPDDAYTIRVRGRVAISDLTDGGDEPIFKERFRPLIAYLAAAELLDIQGQTEDAEKRRRTAAGFLSRMDDYYRRSEDHSPLVLGRRGHVASGRYWRGRLWPWR